MGAVGEAFSDRRSESMPIGVKNGGQDGVWVGRESKMGKLQGGGAMYNTEHSTELYVLAGIEGSSRAETVTLGSVAVKAKRERCS